MDPAHRPLDPDPKPPKPLSFPNGSLKKHPLAPPPAAPPSPGLVYRECLKNHAATLGGHVLDGCGEFMSSPTATPADPTSFKCAACGCHRNFHRRILQPHRLSDSESEEDNDDTTDIDNHDIQQEHQTMTPSPSPPQYFSSAPQMLLALSTAAAPVRPIAPAMMQRQLVSAASAPPRKRFRTKFSTEQKARMQALSERLGWRMQKRDDNLIEDCCREIGVSRGVFKVWMHNNKHNFVAGAARKGEIGSSSSSGGAGAPGGSGVVSSGGGVGAPGGSAVVSSGGGGGVGVCVPGGSAVVSSGGGVGVCVPGGSGGFRIVSLVKREMAGNGGGGGGRHLENGSASCWNQIIDEMVKG